MKKNSPFLALAILALLVLSGCVTLPQPKPPEGSTPGTTPGTTPVTAQPDQNLKVPPLNDLSAIFLACNAKANQYAIDDCFKSYAVQNANPTLCRQLRQLSQDTCLDSVARKANKYIYCGEISAAQLALRDECYYVTSISEKKTDGCYLIFDENKQKTCVSNVALGSQSVALCDQISILKDRDNCYEKAAVSNSDYLLCNLVSVAYEEGGVGFRRDHCLNSVLQKASDEKMCPYYLDKTNAYGCYEVVAKSTNNVSWCDKIASVSQKDACILSVNATLLDSELCFKINDANKQQQCFLAVQQQKPSTSLCNQIADLSARDACYQNAAADSNSATDCRSIMDNLTRYVCYNTIAQAKLDESLCLQIPQLNAQFQDCLSKLAVNALQPSACDKISDASPYISCYAGVAKALGDYTICHQATRTYAVTLIYSSSDLCIKEYAIAKKDRIACQNIVDDNVSQQCQNAIQ